MAQTINQIANQSGGYDNCTVILMENERYQDGSND